MFKPLSICLGITALAFVACNNQAPAPACPVNTDSAKQNVIPASQGYKWIESYRSVADTLKLPQLGLVNYENFNRDAIQILLNVKGAEGIRISMGRNDKNEVVTILAPIDKNGKVIVTKLLPTETGSANKNLGDSVLGEFIEEGRRCPYNCPDQP